MAAGRLIRPGRRGRTAMTLVELLVVIAIIAYQTQHVVDGQATGWCAPCVTPRSHDTARNHAVP